MNPRISKRTRNALAIACVAILLLSSSAQAQTKAKPVTAVPENINLQVYRQSAAIGDLNMAITAVHYLVASDPVKYGTWQDTLAYLYMQNNAYQQAYLLSNALINAKGYTDIRMEIKALSARGLQQPVEAINAYTTLYSKTSNPLFGFEQMQLEYGIHRLAETIVTGNSLLKAITGDKRDSVTVMKADNKSVQRVTFKAAVSNIMGLAYMDLKDKPNAVAQFDVALKESPDFEIAKNNLETAKADAVKVVEGVKK